MGILDRIKDSFRLAVEAGADSLQERIRQSGEDSINVLISGLRQFKSEWLEEPDLAVQGFIGRTNVGNIFKASDCLEISPYEVVCRIFETLESEGSYTKQESSVLRRKFAEAVRTLSTP